MRAARRVGAGALLAALLAVACRSAPAAEPATAGMPRVVIESPSGRSREVRVELARTSAEHERGLMFRKSLAADEGMLFVFPETSEHAFWMKNTLIRLDMIFIGEDHSILGLVERAEPMTTTPRSIGVPCRYVLEVNGGWSASEGVRKGDRVRFVDMPGVR
jgi:uncharacterized membrane protein (UPF0127 family)